MKKAILCVLIFVCLVIYTNAQNEKKWGGGIKSYCIFGRPSISIKFDLDGDIGFGADAYVYRKIYKDKLWLNLGVNLEKNIYNRINWNYDDAYYVMRIDFGTEYQIINIKSKLSANILLGTSIGSIRLKKPNSYYTFEGIEKERRWFPYVALSFDYHFNDKISLGVFTKLNIHCLGTNYNYLTRFSSGIEFKF